jgi:hypothetical protein
LCFADVAEYAEKQFRDSRDEFFRIKSELEAVSFELHRCKVKYNYSYIFLQGSNAASPTTTNPNISSGRRLLDVHVLTCNTTVSHNTVSISITAASLNQGATVTNTTALVYLLRRITMVSWQVVHQYFARSDIAAVVA